MKCQSCRQAWPKGHGFRFCPFCGDLVRVAAHLEEPFVPRVPRGPVGLRDTIVQPPGFLRELAEAFENVTPHVLQIDLQRPEPTPAASPPTSRPAPAAVRPPCDSLAAPTEPTPPVPEPVRPVDPAGQRSGFSETAWFLAGAYNDDLGEREGEAATFEEVERMTEAYAVTEPLPGVVRRRFSLG